jgi:hypothetical protein
MREWRALGVQPLGRNLPENEMATLIEPDGRDATAYLLTTNYRTILDYNCSNFYALSVGLLADAMRMMALAPGAGALDKRFCPSSRSRFRHPSNLYLTALLSCSPRAGQGAAFIRRSSLRSTYRPVRLLSKDAIMHAVISWPR